VLAVILVQCSAGCRGQQEAAPGQLQGTIAVSGAWALYPMMVRWGEEFQKLHPNVQLDISAGGAGKGLADALAGVVEIGMVSRDIAPEEEAKGAFWVPVTKDAVFPTISDRNPALVDLMTRGVPRSGFVGMYIDSSVTTWGQAVGKPEITDAVHVYTRSDACGAAETWAKYLGKKQENLAGIGVYGDPGILETVVKDPMGIAYNNLNYAFDTSTGLPVAGARLVPIDANENGVADPEEILDTKAKAVQAVATGQYPSPPARALNLVTKGKPTGLTKALILWILSDGQRFVDEVGYIQLTEEQLAGAKAKLE
jgi:phosphate transport system substrate-binding protein